MVTHGTSTKGHGYRKVSVLLFLDCAAATINSALGLLLALIAVAIHMQAQRKRGVGAAEGGCQDGRQQAGSELPVPATTDTQWAMSGPGWSSLAWLQGLEALQAALSRGQVPQLQSMQA